MSSTVTLRIIVRDPVPGVTLAVQRGKGELVPPTSTSQHAATFDIVLDVKAGGLRGPEVQGRPGERFIYVNAGTYAGQMGTPWSRRAKVPLSALRPDVIDRAMQQPGSIVAVEIEGRGRDGGPAAAMQRLVESDWGVVVGNR